MKKVRISFLLFGLLMTGTSVVAQEPSIPATRSIHLGHGFVYEQVNEQQYVPVIFAVEESWGVNRGGWLQVFFTARFNPSYVIAEKGWKFAPEGGMQLGLRAGWSIADGHYLFGDISTGPHLITEGLGIQKTGFLFSDNFSFGWLGNLTDRMMLSFQTRFRHMSNANLYQPNIGIDNWMLIGGIHWKK